MNLDPDSQGGGVEQLFQGIRNMLDDLERRVLNTNGATRNRRKVRGRSNQVAAHAVTLMAVPRIPSVSASEPVLDLPAKIRLALVSKSMNVRDISKQIGEPATQVEKVMKELLQQGSVINVMGRGWDKALWRWAVHSKNPENTARRELIKQLLMERPMTHGEIRNAVKATDKQIQEDIVELRRHEMMWKMNVDGHDNLYHLPADRAEPPPQFDARLKPKAYKKPAK